MLLLEPIFLSIIIFGIWSSYTDIKNGKIKNLTVLSILIAGLITNLFFTKTLISSTIKTLINSGLSFLIGYLLWNFGIWSPADAKIFFAFSFLIPITTYSKGSIPYFPSYIILVNTFVPVAIFFLIYSLTNVRPSLFIQRIKEMFKPSSLLNMVVFMLGILSFMSIINKTLNFQINHILRIIVMFLFFEGLRSLKKIVSTIFSFSFLILGIILIPQVILSPQFFVNFLIFFILFQILLVLISNLKLTEKVKIKYLKPGMLLGEHIIKKKEDYKKETSLIVNYFGFLRHIKKNISAEFTGRLKEEDIKKLKKLEEEKKLDFTTVEIARTIPFAPFIFFGVLTTYLVRGTIIVHLITIKDYIWMYIRIFFQKIVLNF